MFQNMYRNVDQYIGQAMEVNNDLEDFLNQESRGKKDGRGLCSEISSYPVLFSYLCIEPFVMIVIVISLNTDLTNKL